MHWRTYERLHARHEAFIGFSLAGMAKKLGLLRGRLEDFESEFARGR